MGFPLVDGWLAEGVGNAPTSAMPILFSRQVQPAYICLPSKNGARGRNLTLISDVRTIALYELSYASVGKMAAQAGLAPAPFRLTNGRTTIIPPGNEIGQRGRSCTCDPSVPSRVRWLLRYALNRPDGLKRSGREKRDAENPGNRPRGKI